VFKYTEVAGFENLECFAPSDIGAELDLLGYTYTNVVGAAASPEGAYYEMGVRKSMLRASVESGDCSSNKTPFFFTMHEAFETMAKKGITCSDVKLKWHGEAILNCDLYLQPCP